MAPRETVKPVTKVQRAVKDIQNIKGRSSPVGAVKKPTGARKTVEKTPLKAATVNVEVRTTRKRTSTVPYMATPKPKDNMSAPAPKQASVTRSAKKPTWKRRPKPAHSGVPVPEKMRKLLEKEFMDPAFDL